MRRQGSGTTCRCRPRSGEPKASERHPSFFWYRAEVPMPESMVEVAKVTKVYQRGRQKIEVLHGLDLDIPKGDRKSTRLNSSHSQISYAVFCLKKKTKAHNASP